METFGVVILGSGIVGSTIAAVLAKDGITVNAVSPGFTEDSVLNSLPPAAQEMVRNWYGGSCTPMGRLRTPAE